MNVGRILLGIVLFAAATAILYAWGLGKAADQQADLTRALLSACGSRVVKHLKKQDTITAAEIAGLIRGVKVGQFWSRKKLTVQDGGKVCGQVIDFLLDQQYIEPAGGETYRLKP